MVPFGARNIGGYRGRRYCAVVRSRQVPLEACQTSGNGLVPSTGLSSPEVTTTSPLGSTVLVGYHRAPLMFGRNVQFPLTGSYEEAFATPVLSAASPPVTKT